MSAIRKMSIAQKLIAVFLILSVLWGLLCSASFIILKDIQRSYSDLLNKQTAALIKTKEIQYHVSAQNYALVAYMEAIGSGAPGNQKSISILNSSNQQVRNLVADISALLDDPSTIENMSKIELS